MKKFTLKFWMDDMGSFEQPGCSSHKDALWHVNKAREHDGLPPIWSLDEGVYSVKEEPSKRDSKGQVVCMVDSDGGEYPV